MEWIQDPLAAIAEFVQINISLSTERDLHTLLAMIVSSARKLTGAEVGRIYVLDRTKRVLFLEVTQNARVNLTRADLQDVPLRTEDGPNTSHVCAYCAFPGGWSISPTSMPTPGSISAISTAVTGSTITAPAR